MRYHVVLDYFDFDYLTNNYVKKSFEIFDMLKEDMILINPVLEKEANTPSSFMFGIYPNNVGYDIIRTAASYIRVYDGKIADENCVFYGIRQSFTEDIDRFIKVSYAGALEFLKNFSHKFNQNQFSYDIERNARTLLLGAFDTNLPTYFNGAEMNNINAMNIQRYYTYDDKVTEQNPFGFLLNDGNEPQTFKNVDWTDFASNYDEETGNYSFEYMTCYDILQKFLELGELYIKLEYTSDAAYYPYNIIPKFYSKDYLNTYKEPVQRIESSKNLLDLVTDSNYADIYSAVTFVDPDTNEVIDDPNHVGRKYYYVDTNYVLFAGYKLMIIKDSDPVAHMSQIDDYSLELLRNQFNNLSFDITSIDKSYYDKESKKLDIYDGVEIAQPWESEFDLYYPVNHIQIDLVSPENSRIIVGSNFFRKDISKIID